MATEKELEEQSRVRIEKIYTVLLGVDNTDDGGMAQDVKEIREHALAAPGTMTADVTLLKHG